MELVPYGEADAGLTAALETDPRVMSGLAGPLSHREATAVHEHRMAGPARGDWYFTVLTDDGERAGVAGVWSLPWRGGTVHEIGLILHWRYHGMGLAGYTFAEVVRRARREGAFAELHAFTDVGNEPAHRLCRRLGFVEVGEEDMDYAGRPMRCTHWVADLTGADLTGADLTG